MRTAFRRISFALGLAALASASVLPAFAERGTTRFKSGDKVEVKHPFDGWKKGTVVGESHFGRIEVRVDDI